MPWFVSNRKWPRSSVSKVPAEADCRTWAAAAREAKVAGSTRRTGKNKHTVWTSQDSCNTGTEIMTLENTQCQCSWLYMEDVNTGAYCIHMQCNHYYFEYKLCIPITSLQIIFVSKQVIFLARDKFWPDKKSVWSDKTCFFITCLCQLVLWSSDMKCSIFPHKHCYIVFTLDHKCPVTVRSDPSKLCMPAPHAWIMHAWHACCMHYTCMHCKHEACTRHACKLALLHAFSCMHKESACNRHEKMHACKGLTQLNSWSCMKMHAGMCIHVFWQLILS